MAQDILPEPPIELKRHSDRLAERIRGAIRDEGPIPFSRYMEMALYEPGLGYYSAGLHKLGQSGDFVTAPELGELFAACLARQVGELAAAVEERPHERQPLDGRNVSAVGILSGNRTRPLRLIVNKDRA